MIDLYGLLGVSPKATDRQIKDAYRRMAKQHHPDLGGDPETFMAVSRAYTVLSDQEMRANYDQTGEVDDGKVTNLFSGALTLIGQLLEEVLAQSKGRVSEIDLIKALAQHGRNILAQHRDELTKIELRLQDLGDLRGRVKRNDDEPNIFVDIFDKKIAKTRMERVSIKKTIAVFERMVDELEHYDSPVDFIRSFQAMMYDGATSTGSGVYARVVTV